MRERRKYTNEFKLDAVKLVESSGLSTAQVARDLGIGDTALHRWVKQFGQRADGTRFTPEQQEELMRLRRENTLLRMERDILKKAIGICSQELP
jgi:transposase